MFHFFLFLLVKPRKKRKNENTYYKSDMNGNPMSDLLFHARWNQYLTWPLKIIFHPILIYLDNACTILDYLRPNDEHSQIVRHVHNSDINLSRNVYLDCTTITISDIYTFVICLDCVPVRTFFSLPFVVSNIQGLFQTIIQLWEIQCKGNWNCITRSIPKRLYWSPQLPLGRRS